MPKEYLREQLWKLYKKLPEELQEAVFSQETADSIGNACERNQVPENKIPEVAERTGYVLSGLLPPNEFEDTLIKKVKLKAETAKNVAREINRFIFFPVKEILSKLYEIEIDPPARPPGVIKEVKPKTSPEKEKPETTDTYREAIE
ncbi:hypothetical protein IH779_00350 [Patescibacteria group bacterium]|nr:hypothetical protein [Patescibacteria group bacterium]